MKDNKVVIFLSRFLLFSIPFMVFNLFNMRLGFLEIFLRDVVRMVLVVYGFETSVFNTLNFNNLQTIPALFVNGLVVGFDTACTGIRSSFLLFALVFATGKENFFKIKYFLTGVLLLFVANVVRIVMGIILYSSTMNLALFDSLMWAGFLNIIVLLLFYFLNIHYYSINK